MPAAMVRSRTSASLSTRSMSLLILLMSALGTQGGTEQIMKRYHQPSGIRQGLELLIDQNWSPDQALAVIELLDDLRDRIWSHYEIALQQKLRDERITRYNAVISDPPF